MTLPCSLKNIIDYTLLSKIQFPILYPCLTPPSTLIIFVQSFKDLIMGFNLKKSVYLSCPSVEKTRDIDMTSTTKLHSC